MSKIYTYTSCSQKLNIKRPYPNIRKVTLSLTSIEITKKMKFFAIFAFVAIIGIDYGKTYVIVF